MTDTASFTALVLAGQRQKHDPVAKAGNASCKAFAEIEARPMITYVLDSLLACDNIDDIYICIDENLLCEDECPALLDYFQKPQIHKIQPQNSPSASVDYFLGSQSASRVLITTADHPLLTSAMISQFIESFAKSNADAAAAVTPTDMIEQCYPQCKRTKIMFSDGSYTGCNLFAISGEKSRRVVKFWQKIDNLRKTPWKIFSVIGLATFVKYISGRLSLRDAVRDLGDKVDAQLWPVILLDPHAGIDIDTADDLALVKQIFQNDELQRQQAQLASH